MNTFELLSLSNKGNKDENGRLNVDVVCEYEPENAKPSFLCQNFWACRKSERIGAKMEFLKLTAVRRSC